MIRLFWVPLLLFSHVGGLPTKAFLGVEAFALPCRLPSAAFKSQRRCLAQPPAFGTRSSRLPSLQLLVGSSSGGGTLEARVREALRNNRWPYGGQSPRECMQISEGVEYSDGLLTLVGKDAYLSGSFSHIILKNATRCSTCAGLLRCIILRRFVLPQMTTSSRRGKVMKVNIYK